jgi:drug/metabolite transporter superfamily protein YnfA
MIADLIALLGGCIVAAAVDLAWIFVYQRFRSSPGRVAIAYGVLSLLPVLVYAIVIASVGIDRWAVLSSIAVIIGVLMVTAILAGLSSFRARQTP